VRLVVAILIVLVVTAISIAAMLLVRRGAPDGSYFNDGDRAAGVFGVLATGFAVLLGFVVFLSFTSYDSARTGAEAEALVVTQQLETAQFFAEPAATELTGELVCYARSVAGVQWDRMESGTLGDQINPWASDMFRTVRTVEPQTAAEQSAYDRWMDQTGEREQARLDRVHGAEGLIPAPLWISLFVLFGVIIVFMLFFADPGEGAVTQGMLMGSITAALTMLLLLLVHFNDPHGEGAGQLQPTAMERSLRVIDAELVVAGLDLNPPCDSDGTAR
jgi:ABC-type multidrug transport system fused ATPase/permease subunit